MTKLEVSASWNSWNSPTLGDVKAPDGGGNMAKTLRSAQDSVCYILINKLGQSEGDYVVHIWLFISFGIKDNFYLHVS